jgi:hypothetical protein
MDSTSKDKDLSRLSILCKIAWDCSDVTAGRVSLRSEPDEESLSGSVGATPWVSKCSMGVCSFFLI